MRAHLSGMIFTGDSEINAQSTTYITRRCVLAMHVQTALRSGNAPQSAHASGLIRMQAEVEPLLEQGFTRR